MINWDVKITNVNMVSKRADVTATRTDSTSALTPHTYTLSNTPLETGADRTLVLNTIKEWETTAKTKETADNTFISTLEQTAKTALENWELTR